MLGRTALRFALEAAVIVAAAVAVALNDPSWSKVIAVMAPVYVLVAGFEWLVSRGRHPRSARAGTAASPARPEPPGGAPAEVSVTVLQPAPRAAPRREAEIEAQAAGEPETRTEVLTEQVEQAEREPRPEPPGGAAGAEPPPAEPPVAEPEPDLQPAPASSPEAEPAPAAAGEQPAPATPEPQPEPEPEPGLVRPPLVIAPPPAPELEAPPHPEPPPAAAEESDVIPLVQRGPRSWNIWELERLCRQHAGADSLRDEERGYLLVYLREFAGADGVLPVDFDGLVRESFGELVEAG